MNIENMESGIDNVAKLYLSHHCFACLHFVDAGPGLCKARKFNSISGHAAASMKKKYGVAALKVYPEFTCNKWKAMHNSSKVEEIANERFSN
jgi:hypothetical protein